MDPEKPRPVWDFAGSARARLVRFIRYWEVQHRQDPKNFPLNLDENQWWERFDTWDRIDEDEKDK